LPTIHLEETDMTKLNDEALTDKAPALAAAPDEPDRLALFKKDRNSAWRAWTRANRRLVRLTVQVVNRTERDGWAGLAKAALAAARLDAEGYTFDGRARATVALHEELCAIGRATAEAMATCREGEALFWKRSDFLEQIGAAAAAAMACLRLLSLERSDARAWCREFAWGEHGFEASERAALALGRVPLRSAEEISDLLGVATSWVRAELEKDAGW
jgi:hypothetical protein